MARTDRAQRCAPGLALALAVWLVIGCAGCATRPSNSGDLVVGSTSATRLRVAAEIYAGVLRHAGAHVADHVAIGDGGALLDGVATGRLDLFPTFTGDTLALLSPESSTSAAPEPSAAAGADDGLDARYVQLNASLPQGVTAGDATPVRDDAGDSLVPVYRSAVLSRDQVRTVNQVAGELTTADLDAMVGAVDRGTTDATQAASAWVGEHGL